MKMRSNEVLGAGRGSTEDESEEAVTGKAFTPKLLRNAVVAILWSILLNCCNKSGV